MQKVTILALRRELTSPELEALQRSFPGMELGVKVVHPVDYLEHDALCQQLQPACVVLPKDMPIPSLAMKHGFAHVDIRQDGTVHELLPLKPEFKPFIPK